jgi:hypothetical protein
MLEVKIHIDLIKVTLEMENSTLFMLKFNYKILVSLTPFGGSLVSMIYFLCNKGGD